MLDTKPKNCSFKRVSWLSHRDTLRAIREQVFIVEQSVPRDIEWDDQDRYCNHFLGTVDGEPAACARMTSDGKVGRMAVLGHFRNQGVGAELLSYIIETAGQIGLNALSLNAQIHASSFYKRAGFIPQGNVFVEAGIEHIHMTRKLQADA